jgi:hypothetical protein
MKRIIIATTLSLVASQALTAGKNVAPTEAPIVPVPHSEWSVDAKIGTLGIGVDISRMVSDNVAVRFNVNGLKIKDIKESIEGIDFSADVNLFSAGVVLDYYPMEDSSFRVSVGGYYDDNNVEATATSTGTITIDGTPYKNTVLASVDGKFTANTTVPYVGIGWGKSTESGWSLSADIGVFYHGTPDAEITPHFTATATAAEKTAVNASIKKYKVDVLDAINYNVYPVVMIGAKYTF